MNKCVPYLIEGKLSDEYLELNVSKSLDFENGVWALNINSISVEGNNEISNDLRCTISSDSINFHYSSIDNSVVHFKPAPLCHFNFKTSLAKAYIKHFPLLWFEIRQWNHGCLKFYVRSLEASHKSINQSIQVALHVIIKRVT